MARILAVGGAGYIGSHTCKALAAAGHEPVVFDNLSTGHSEFVKWGELIEGDILDPDALARAFESSGAQAMVHFAALAYVGDSVEDPRAYYRNNVVGSLNLFDAALAAGVDKLVFSSTCATYGAPDAMPITEETPQQPINPYGRTKLMIEQALADYGAAYGLKSVCLRYFNACGADPDGEIGEDHDPEPHVIPRALLGAMGQIDFRVFGGDYPTPDGSAVRDYIHVSDLADAHVAAVEHLLRGGESERVNLGVGRGFSVYELLDSVERVTGWKAERVPAKRRAGDPPELVADPSRARRVLGFKPRFTEMDDIIRTAWSWHLRRHNQPPRS